MQSAVGNNGGSTSTSGVKLHPTKTKNVDEFERFDVVSEVSPETA